VLESLELYCRVLQPPALVEETIAPDRAGVQGRRPRGARSSPAAQRRRRRRLALVVEPPSCSLDEPTTLLLTLRPRQAWDDRRSATSADDLPHHHLHGRGAAPRDRVYDHRGGDNRRLKAPRRTSRNATRRRRRSAIATPVGGRSRSKPSTSPELPRLTTAALANGEELEGLVSTRPRLEYVYLDLTSAAEGTE